MFLFSSPIPNVLKYVESCIRLKPGERREALNIHSLKGINKILCGGQRMLDKSLFIHPTCFRACPLAAHLPVSVSRDLSLNNQRAAAG